jgi:hypothetical protein
VFRHFEQMAMMRVSEAWHVRMLHEGFRIWELTRRALTRALRDPYRPEQYYMRGPGPKYRAKAAASKDDGSAGICRGRSKLSQLPY